MLKKGSVAIIENLYGGLGDYCYRRVAMRYENDFQCIRIDARKDVFPHDVAAWAEENDIAGVVIDGSEKSPLDPDEWIRCEEKFVAACYAARIPLLGICFGHEIITSALGGKLTLGDSPRVVLDEVEVIVPDALFEGLAPRFLCPSAHRVRTSRMPPGFIHIARCADCEIMGMRHPDFPFYGVQFHPEADAGIKVHDPDWNPVSDEEFARSDGDRALDNFRDILIALNKV